MNLLICDCPSPSTVDPFSNDTSSKWSSIQVDASFIKSLE
ncbi:hypothetical protein BVRB_4g072560 [Beta vulgaris subsp. vulgaris]|nr:hypothetical protein BVRB_4g072560 [Beta vulgaris subsp. vulgaris]